MSDLAEVLGRFPEVTWDRCAGDDENLVAYGWIARDDGRSDFLLIRFENGGLGFTTSSAALSADFHRRLFGDDDGDHFPCRPIEDVVPGVRHVVRAPCGAMVAWCRCVAPRGHVGPHRCEPRCGGSWEGDFDAPSFRVVALPGLAALFGGSDS